MLVSSFQPFQYIIGKEEMKANGENRADLINGESCTDFIDNSAFVFPLEQCHSTLRRVQRSKKIPQWWVFPIKVKAFHYWNTWLSSLAWFRALQIPTMWSVPAKLQRDFWRLNNMFLWRNELSTSRFIRYWDTGFVYRRLLSCTDAQTHTVLKFLVLLERLLVVQTWETSETSKPLQLWLNL